MNAEVKAFTRDLATHISNSTEAYLSPTPHDGLGHQNMPESPPPCPLCLGVSCYIQRL